MLLSGLIIVFFGLCLILFIDGFHIVPEEERWVIELMGKYYNTWNPGWNFLIPVFMSVRNKVKIYDQPIDISDGVKEITVDFTDDSAPIDLRATMRIVDPYKVTYNASNWIELSKNLIASELRKVFGAMTFDQAISSKDEVVKHVEEKIRAGLQNWGIDFGTGGITVLDIKTSQDTVTFRRSTHRAQKEKQVLITIAEGESEAKVIKADAESRAQVLLGKGEMGKIQEIARGLQLSPEQVIAFLLTGKLYDAMRSATIVATSESGVINIPAVASVMEKIKIAMEKNR